MKKSTVETNISNFLEGKTSLKEADFSSQVLVSEFINGDITLDQVENLQFQASLFSDLQKYSKGKEWVFYLLFLPVFFGKLFFDF